MPWNLVTFFGKMHANTYFSSDWVDILVYLLDTYLEQIIIVEGTKEPRNGKIKETTKDLNYDVDSALNIVSCVGLRKCLVPGNVKSLMFVVWNVHR